MPKKNRPSTRRKRNKYGDKLPPKKPDYTFITPRGFAGTYEQLTCLNFSKNDKTKLIYFKVILKHKFTNDWKDVVSFDTYHKNRTYLHGHTMVNGKKKLLKNIPDYEDLNKARRWLNEHMNKKWRYYVKLFIRNNKKL